MKTASANTTNRRAGPRKILRRAATLVLPGGLEREVRTWDLGVDGLCILSSKPISPGSRCQVTFDVPLSEDRSSTVTVPVKVVYSSFSGAEGFKVGTVFSGLDDDSADAITEFATRL
jgi:hypothetical protein